MASINDFADSAVTRSPGLMCLYTSITASSFYNYDGGVYCAKFQFIDKIIFDWKNDLSYNAEKYIIKFFSNLDAGQTWITYSANLAGISNANFPSTGFFTDQVFTIQELEQSYER